MMKETPRVARRTPLVKNLLILDGIGRSGKFLAGNILNGFTDVEPAQLCGLLEHIPYYEKLGFIETRAAEELLHHEIDMHCYEMLIGRNINHRRSDKSSIYNVAHSEAYLARSEELDPDKELARFYADGVYSLFLVHEVLPDMEIYFNAFPDIKVISITRSPVDLVHSWLLRDAMDRWATDPKFFNIPIEGKKGVLPWYMHEFQEEYETLCAADRIIFIIETLFARYERALAEFTDEHKKKILFISYEDILAEPIPVVGRIRDFLGKEPTDELSAILAREHLPNPHAVSDGKAAKLEHLSSIATPGFFERLRVLEQAYAEGRTYGHQSYE